MSDDKQDAKSGPHLRYTEHGRSGTIHYISPEATFDLWYELAMPPAVADIGIPEPRYWENRTQTSLSQREVILRLIGQQVINDKLTGEGYFLFNDQIMTVYSGRKPDVA